MNMRSGKVNLDPEGTRSPAGCGRDAKKILVVDDEPFDCGSLRNILERGGAYEVLTADTGPRALDQVHRLPPDAVLLDVMLPAIDGLEVLKELKLSHPALPVIMLTGMTDVRMAVEAIQLGAYNYLTKPFDGAQLLLILAQAIEKSEMLAEMRSLRSRAGKRGPALSKIAGRSPAILEVMEQVQKVADSNLTVIIQGETGTGKEPVARALHEESSRREGPFVAVDCGALPENLLESELFGHEKGAFSGADRRKPGQFELAGNGTLFLDEIGNLPLSLQAKLLRVLQERQVRPVGATQAFPVQARVIAATNLSLEGAARTGQFRQDLYYRLAEFTLQLPPLRRRPEDILPLAQRFREEASLEFRRPVAGLTEEAEALLRAHAWPGNIRELRNVVRQAVLLTPDSSIHAEQIKVLLGAGGESPAPVAVPVLPGQPLRRIVEHAAGQVERQAILNVLKSAGGNKSRAAKILDVDYKTLRLKIKKYGLDSGDERGPGEDPEA
ncbi:MAG TPA: sigma-54 dependent transcriptional regulator [bacterium]|nr:sigma-54 dependent transcriptional regulator [bacterium]